MLLKGTDSLVRVRKTSKIASDKAGDGAPSAARKKRSIRSKVAGAGEQEARRGAGRAAISPDAGASAATTPGATRDPSQAAAARSAQLRAVVLSALDDMKAWEIKVLDVRGLTDMADTIVIASGTSDRHIRAVAQKLIEKTKEAGFRAHGIEGQRESDWILIDLNEIVVHVMLPRVREFYGLEKLWDMTQPKRAQRA